MSAHRSALSHVSEESLGLSLRLAGTALDRGAPASDQLEYQRDHGQHQQYVDKSTHGVAADNSQQPENKQNYK
jgi:hypothetical protein